MNKLLIQGKAKLTGQIIPSGSKNSALPILIATLLTKNKVILTNLPNLYDIKLIINILLSLNSKIQLSNNSLIIKHSNLSFSHKSFLFTNKIRASILFLGILTHRFKKIYLSFPGGCSIGDRKIDYHLISLKKMGFNITIKNKYIYAEMKKYIHSKIILPFPSVGTTQQILLTASLIEKNTLIKNAAKEPEVVELCYILIKMGVNINGIGTSTLSIYGKKNLTGFHHHISDDRIEIGTFLTASSFSHTQISIHSKYINYNKNIKKNLNNLTNIITQVYPGFSTDLQSLYMISLVFFKKNLHIFDTIFEKRFSQIFQLNKFGANISYLNKNILIKAHDLTFGCQINPQDLRTSASLILTSLFTTGVTMISSTEFLDRGYSNFEYKLTAIGAYIIRIQ